MKYDIVNYIVIYSFLIVFFLITFSFSTAAINLYQFSITR